MLTEASGQFGVQVSSVGSTTSHVFCGLVRVQMAGGDGRQREVVLRASESVAVERGADRVAAVSRATAAPGVFVRQMPRPMPIEVFNTGIGLKEGDPDPHWQLVAVSNDPHFQPGSAVVTRVVAPLFLPNNPSRSQWISTTGDFPELPEDVTYTFRTTFELKDVATGSAVLRGGFMADNHVGAIRLNGIAAPVPEHGYGPPFDRFHPFAIDRGFVEGTNVLEIEVANVRLSGPPIVSRMALLVELEGSAIRGWDRPAAASTDTPPANGGKEGRNM